MLIDEAVFGAATTPHYYTKLYQSLDVFDKNFEGEEPNAFESPTKFSLTVWLRAGEKSCNA
ncbi:MAG: hypothetical protein R2738_01075 [Bacteroides graminisolvens]